MLFEKIRKTITTFFNTKLSFTDTDTWCYEIYGKKPHKKIYKHNADLSNLPVSSKYYCSNNNKVLGKMKDEYGGKSIVKSVGLKSVQKDVHNIRWT